MPRRLRLLRERGPNAPWSPRTVPRARVDRCRPPISRWRWLKKPVSVGVNRLTGPLQSRTDRHSAFPRRASMPSCSSPSHRGGSPVTVGSMLSTAAVTGRADCQQENCPFSNGFSVRPQSTTSRIGRGLILAPSPLPKPSDHGYAACAMAGLVGHLGNVGQSVPQRI
jgi:hypothetical protein